MADIVFVAVALGFFALCALYVRWCDRIIGPDVIEDVTPVVAIDESVAREVVA